MPYLFIPVSLTPGLSLADADADDILHSMSFNPMSKSRAGLLATISVELEGLAQYIHDRMYIDLLMLLSKRIAHPKLPLLASV